MRKQTTRLIKPSIEVKRNSKKGVFCSYRVSSISKGVPNYLEVHFLMRSRSAI
jgi:hypothetical protein